MYVDYAAQCRVFLVLTEDYSQVCYWYCGHPWLMLRKTSRYLTLLCPNTTRPVTSPKEQLHISTSQFASSSSITGHLLYVTPWSQAPWQLLSGQKATWVPQTLLGQEMTTHCHLHGQPQGGQHIQISSEHGPLLISVLGEDGMWDANTCLVMVMGSPGNF